MKKYAYFIICAMTVLSGGCSDSIKKEVKPACQDLGQVWLMEFAPQSINIVGLTGFSKIGDKKILKVYLVLLDQAGAGIKSPLAVRAELYEHSPRSPVPKGKRIEFWPDMDLNNAKANNQYWRDYLRAYEFSFDADSAQQGRSYLLEVTAQLPGSRRVSAMKELNF
ncbi:MAG: hypothetical protein A2Y07_05930 [Planctomycetes bacterium GWF2_50_10]|nr:MAG: hypothetical protein A2Y07_05930 [Planctomycetes bacterium GWF2_50_10]